MSARFLAVLAIGFAVGVTPIARADAVVSDDERHVAVPPERSTVPPLPPEYATVVIERAGIDMNVAYHPSARERVLRLVPEIGGAEAELERTLGRPFAASVAIRIVGLDVELPVLAGVHAIGATGVEGDFEDPAGVIARGGALAEPSRLIVLSAGPGAGGEPRDLEVSVRYQLARLALLDAAPTGVPSWFRDGFAAQFARGAELGSSATLLWATLRGALPSGSEMSEDDPVSRAFAAETARVLTESRSGSGMRRWVTAMRDGATFDDALVEAHGPGLEAAVRERIASRLAWVVVMASGFALGAILAGMALWRRRRRSLSRARARALAQAPALELIDPILGVAQLAASVDADDHVGVIAPRTGPSHVRHDGAWHTLH